MTLNTLIYYSLSAGVLIVATYLLIIRPQKILEKKMRILAQNLTPGVWVQTHDGVSGTILHVHEHSVLVRQESGKIVEVLKQSIESIRSQP